jgi:hypothetical protein
MDSGRRHAAPMLPPVSGLPLIRSVPSLGFRAEERKANCDVEVGMSPDQRKARVKWGVEVFLAWMKKEGAEYIHDTLRVEGPFPHFDPKEPNTQYGDAGGKRKVARKLGDDLPEGKEDYVIIAMFKVREALQEIPTELAQQLFADPNRQSHIKPLREREWRKSGARTWSQRN